MSCGRIALERANIKVNNYFASEIDKHAIKVTISNYPDTIQLGSVIELDTTTLPQIDLLIGGSPCQSFSIAGNGLGFDGKSKLFFEYVRILKEIKPKYFLLENVKMKKEWQNTISEYLGVEPIEINSCLLSGQHRRRLYWTNIPNIQQPEDKNISLSSILEDVNIDKIYGDIKAPNGKTIRIEPSNYPYTFYEARTDEGKAERKRVRELTGLDTTPRSAKYKIYLPLRANKSNCILATPSQLDYVVDNNGVYRKLTITELIKLQTIPTNYFGDIVSDSQIRKMVGNGWTVDVITHIFKSII
jgi:site-specific DNA-cytosine methylase